MPLRSIDPARFAEAGSLCDSGAQAPHPWGHLSGMGDPGSTFEPRPWHADPWQDLDADYRCWQQARYRQFADEFDRDDGR